MQKRRLPKKLNSVTIKETVGCGSLYVTLNKDARGDPRQVVAHLGKGGDCARVMLEAICRCINIGLDRHIPLGEYIRGLEMMRCPKPVVGEKHITSCPDCVAKILKEEK